MGDQARQGARFWLVWNENGHAPTFKHASATSARTEAERLARLNPGATFHVLALAGSCVKRDVDWTDALADEMPF